MNIVAMDENSNTYNFTVELILIKDRLIVSLGAPYEWRYNDLIIPPVGTDRLYIDAAGRNHKGSPVSCNYYELIEIINTLQLLVPPIKPSNN